MTAIVFPSSTSRDLPEYRAAVLDACRALNLGVATMEDFPAMGLGATQGSLNQLDRCHVYLGIFAQRYGYVEDGCPCSVTEAEYDHAKKRGLECLCFFLADGVPWPEERIEYNALPRLQALKQRIQGERIVRWFRNPDDLKFEAYRALLDWLERTGRKTYETSQGPAPFSNSGELNVPRGQAMSTSSAPGARRADPDELDCLVLGRLTTEWLVVDGDGVSCYTRDNIVCRVDPVPLKYPPLVQEFRQGIEVREAQKAEDGLSAQWNGPLFALCRYSIRRVGTTEQLAVTFTFAETDYFTFQATIMSLDTPPVGGGQTLRELYVPRDRKCYEPVPFLANGIGVALVVVTRDDYCLLLRRHDTVGARRGQLDVSAVEGIHPFMDMDHSRRTPDLYRTAQRGSMEEIGVALSLDDIRLLGFGLDLQFYQWNVIGWARASVTAAEATAQRSRGTSGKWEAVSMETVRFEPHAILELLAVEPMWSTGRCALYWALVNEYGKLFVDRAVRDVLGS